MRMGNRNGFSLTELMMALGIMGLVMAAGTVTYLMSLRVWHQTSAISKAYLGASTAIERILGGVGVGYGLRSALPGISIEVPEGGWTIAYTAPSRTSGFGTEKHYVRYDRGRGVIEYTDDSMGGLWSGVGQDVVDSAVAQDGEFVFLSVTTRELGGRDSATSTMGTTVRIRNLNY